MSDTPRTDAFASREDNEMAYYAALDFARALERELEDALNEKENLGQLLHEYMEDYECLNWLAINGNGARSRSNGHQNLVVWETNGDENRKRVIRERIKIKMEREAEEPTRGRDAP